MAQSLELRMTDTPFTPEPGRIGLYAGEDGVLRQITPDGTTSEVSPEVVIPEPYVSDVQVGGDLTPGGTMYNNLVQAINAVPDGGVIEVVGKIRYDLTLTTTLDKSFTVSCNPTLGRATIEFDHSMQPHHYWHIQGAGSITLKNLRFEQVGSAYSSRINVSQSVNLTVEDVVFENVGLVHSPAASTKTVIKRIHMNNTRDVNALTLGTNDVIVLDSYIVGSNSAAESVMTILGTAADGSNSVLIKNTVIIREGSDDTPTAVYMDRDGGSVVFDNCMIIAEGGIAFKISGDAAVDPDVIDILFCKIKGWIAMQAGGAHRIRVMQGCLVDGGSSAFLNYGDAYTTTVGSCLDAFHCTFLGPFTGTGAVAFDSANTTNFQRV